MMSERKTTKLNSPDKELVPWLKRQATKLKTLEVKGRKLKFDFVQNARDKGAILSEVEKRLLDTGTSLKAWVQENTDIGYSTALLYMDVARNFDDVKKRFADSNGLELTLRQVRDAIRDARQERGEGRPGSGRTLPSSKTEETDSAADNGHTDEVSDQEEADDAGEDDAPDEARWEREVAKAEAEAAVVENASKTDPVAPLYKVTVMAFADADQEAMYQALLNWSPVRKTSLGTKQVRSVYAGVGPNDIGTVLEKLGKALETNQPQKVRVSIEL